MTSYRSASSTRSDSEVLQAFGTACGVGHTGAEGNEYACDEDTADERRLSDGEPGERVGEMLSTANKSSFAGMLMLSRCRSDSDCWQS